jgi:hypothetical protein
LRLRNNSFFIQAWVDRRRKEGCFFDGLEPNAGVSAVVRDRGEHEEHDNVRQHCNETKIKSMKWEAVWGCRKTPGHRGLLTGKEAEEGECLNGLEFVTRPI